MGWRVWVAAALLLAILGGGLVCRTLVADHCRQVEDLLRQAREGRMEPLEQALELWERRLPFLSSLLNHEVLEEVGACLARARGRLESGDRAGCREEIEGALYLLDDVREYDRVSGKNLL